MLRSSSWTSLGIVTALVAAAGFAGIACSRASDDAESGGEAALTADANGMKQTLVELAAFGEKRVGTPEGARAASYVMERMKAAGLANVHFEEFNFPQHIANVPASSFEVAINGTPVTPIPFDVFEGSGNGRAQQAQLVYVGSAKPADLAGKDLRGKIAFVARDGRYHRSSQYRNVAAAGAVAMLYISAVPGNQIQIGSIREKWESMGPIPTITIGKEDGEKLRCMIGAGNNDPSKNTGENKNKCVAVAGEVRATIDVKARNARGKGRNVVGVVPGRNFGMRDSNGTSLDHQIVFGAHYDTWYVGSVDNGCGVAALLGLADVRGRPAAPPEYTIVFVAFDGEEVALYGGYDYLRLHQNDGMLTVVNFEMPAAETDVLTGGFETLVSGVATSRVAVLENALKNSDATGLFTSFAVNFSLDKIAHMFGGIIPTDIQGMYRSGIPTITTASSSPWYHTRLDTPDKVDTTALARAVRTFERTTDSLLATPLEGFRGLDPTLWDASVDVLSGPKEKEALIQVTLSDGKGHNLPRTDVTGTFFCDDFFASREVVVKTDDQGVARFTFRDELVNCGGRRWVHVTAGPEFPLVEKVRSVP